jgi:hypothetical protein
MLQASGIAPIVGTRKRPAASQVADEEDEIRSLEVSRHNLFGTHLHIFYVLRRTGYMF